MNLDKFLNKGKKTKLIIEYNTNIYSPALGATKVKRIETYDLLYKAIGKLKVRIIRGKKK